MSDKANDGAKNPVLGGLSSSGNLDVVEATMTLGKRQWTEMWGYVKHAHQLLEATTKAPSDHADLRFDATTFFILCYHLCEWIGNDRGNTLHWTKIVQDMKKSDAMTICQAATNTAKHYKRRADLPIAQISSVTIKAADDVRNTSARIVYDLGQDHRDRDLMAVADECMVWWRKYLQDHNLKGD
jgi:hypothetical protein